MGRLRNSGQTDRASLQRLIQFDPFYQASDHSLSILGQLQTNGINPLDAARLPCGFMPAPILRWWGDPHSLSPAHYTCATLCLLLCFPPHPALPYICHSAPLAPTPLDNVIHNQENRNQR
jgi:hypothetical protein